MKLTILCYDKCSTCKKALNWLDEKRISYEKRPIKEQNPSKEELAVWHKKSGLPLKRFFNTSGNLYKELGLKDKLPQMTEERGPAAAPGRQQPAPETAAPAAEKSAVPCRENQAMSHCPACGTWYRASSDRCPVCGRRPEGKE